MDEIKVGDIILVRYPFDEDKKQFKIRPSLIIERYQDTLEILILKMTTSPPRNGFDYAIKKWNTFGLDKPSTVRISRKLVIEKASILKLLGTISNEDLSNVMKIYNSLKYLG
ncbi:MAG: type II toxin-antitoxin system PemK/MazF family toxin [Defluviitaleaceae bacterium]|nr:type II toxin-antitoxin system PemK/MazF family toxin [Defluviitaleaceae bacterium]